MDEPTPEYDPNEPFRQGGKLYVPAPPTEPAPDLPPAPPMTSEVAALAPGSADPDTTGAA